MVKKEEPLNWELSCNYQAGLIIRTEMAKRGLKFPELTQKLNDMFQLKENERNIRNRVARATFSAGFFIMCLRAMDAMEIKIEKTC